jgi:hypothetical protein
MNTYQKSSLMVFVITGTDASQTFIVRNEPTPPLTLQSGEHGLEYGDVATIKRTGQTLRVIAGKGWITFNGEDRVVLAGQEIVLEPGMDAAIVTALENGPLVYRLYEAPAK